jgi:hypothetical protein
VLGLVAVLEQQQLDHLRLVVVVVDQTLDVVDVVLHLLLRLRAHGPVGVSVEGVALNGERHVSHGLSHGLSHALSHGHSHWRLLDFGQLLDGAHLLVGHRHVGHGHG